jgi:hypothetical protein
MLYRYSMKGRLVPATHMFGIAGVADPGYGWIGLCLSCWIRFGIPDPNLDPSIRCNYAPKKDNCNIFVIFS